MSGGAVAATALEQEDIRGPHQDSGASEAKAVGTSRWTPYLLLSPGMLWLAVFFVVPTVALLVTSLYTGSLDQGYTFTFPGNWSTYSDALSTYYPQYFRSFVYAALATVFCLLLAYPLAYFIAFRAGRWKSTMLVLVIAPFFTSFLIRTLAWQTILADDGWIVQTMNTLHITNVLTWLHLTEPGRVINTPLAVVTGLTYNFLPFMVLPLYASLDRMDSRLIEAAQDLYSSAWTSLRKVTWPLSLPGVVAGTLLTFIPAVGDYINSELLGSPKTTMIGNVIQDKFFSEVDYPTMAALSVVLMVAVLIIVSIYVRRAGTEELV